MATAGRAPEPPLGPSVDQRSSASRAEKWDSERDVSFTLTLFEEDAFRSAPSIPTSTTWATATEGIVIDVTARAGEINFKILGVASTGRSPETWNDDEFPEVEGHELILGLDTDDFWIGMFAADHR